MRTEGTTPRYDNYGGVEGSRIDADDLASTAMPEPERTPCYS